MAARGLSGADYTERTDGWRGGADGAHQRKALDLFALGLDRLAADGGQLAGFVVGVASDAGVLAGVLAMNTVETVPIIRTANF